MKSILIMILSFLSFETWAQEIYVKTVDIKLANDSVSQYINSQTDFSITFSKHSYWASRNDTTQKPNLYNSTLHLYSDSTNSQFAIIVNPYFISEPKKLKLQSIGYFEIFRKELLETELRPSKQDFIRELDSNKLKRIQSEYPDLPKEIAIEWSYPLIEYQTSTDGVTMTISLNLPDTIRQIKFSDQKFNVDDKFFQYNSKLAIYTFQLLLELDWDLMMSSIDYLVDFNQKGCLNEKDRINWLLKEIPKRIDELHYLEKDLKDELERLD